MTKKKFQVLAIFLALVFLFIAGPREHIGLTPSTPNIPDNPEAYIARSESKIHGIVEGTEKKIIRFDGKPTRTSNVIVYLHGFSASRQEISPVCENIAKTLHANLYFTRLKGHGINDPDALGKVRTRDWLEDAEESFAVGRKLGNRIILIATSTGAPLAVWLAKRHPNDIKALVLLSPNFQVADPRTKVLLLPWGRQLAHLLAGKYHSWKPKSKLEAKYWTYRYDSAAIVSIVYLSHWVLHNAPPSRLKTPLEIFYTPSDKVVSLPAVHKFYEEYGGSTKQIISVTNAKSHVLTGRIQNPQTTKEVTAKILAFIESLK